MRRVLLAAFLALPLLGVTHQPAQACACCGALQVVNVESWDTLNVRSGPGVRYRVVGELAPGTTCIISLNRCVRNWCKINFDRTTGWVNRRYIAVQTE